MAESAPESMPINFPEWTDYRLRGGLDPLGMQNTSVNLYQSLVPGISNVTLRIRYYGLYAWLCRTYARHEGSDDPQRWKRYVRRAEALYALTSHHGGGTYGVAGSTWASKAYAAIQNESVDFAAGADPGSDTPYLQQAWGAYGAAYGSQLYEIGIFWESPAHSLPVLSTPIGEALADAFEESLGETAPLLVEVIERGTVHLSELDRFQTTLPFNIDPYSTERRVYHDLLFAANDPDTPTGESRKSTILLVLRVTRMLGRVPGPQELRWILYSRQDAQGCFLEIPSNHLEAQRKRWWVYHANDLCHLALETLLKFLLDNIAEHPNGVTPQHLIGTCVDRLCNANHSVPETWRQLISEASLGTNPYTQENESSEWSLANDILKSAGRTGPHECSSETAWKAIVLLATLYQRAHQFGSLDDTALSGLDSTLYQNLLTETRFLERNEMVPLSELFAKLYEQRILRRHLWVAARKFTHGDYTFLIESDEGRLRLRAKDGPILTNPRLVPTVQFLRDIHLIGESGLTDLGAEALHQA